MPWCSYRSVHHLITLGQPGVLHCMDWQLTPTFLKLSLGNQFKTYLTLNLQHWYCYFKHYTNFKMKSRSTSCKIPVLLKYRSLIKLFGYERALAIGQHRSTSVSVAQRCLALLIVAQHYSALFSFALINSGLFRLDLFQKRSQNFPSYLVILQGKIWCQKF